MKSKVLCQDFATMYFVLLIAVLPLLVFGETTESTGTETTTLSQVKNSITGNPCKANPCGNGICKLDLENSTRDYHCYCEDGFTGEHCQTDWDECWSNPCQNGATCIDQIADFNCTCPSGFSGKVCEINVNECLSDPCQHNGTCVDSIDGYHCECLRGFNGPNCEIDITVCNSTEKRCSNGGQCIEGLGEAFFCYCPVGWQGETCDDDVNECLETPCENGGVCMNYPGDFFCSCTFGFAGDRCNVVLEQCETNPCQNGALCFVVDDSYQCYCVPDFHGHHCQYKYNDCLLPPFPKCLNGGKCRDGVDSFTCTCPSGFSGTYCECSTADNVCLDRNETLTWTLPPNFEELWENATLLSTDEDPTPSPLTELDGSIISPTAAQALVPTSIIVYNVTGSDDINASPVTSLYIYEISSSELVTRSFLAGDDFIIKTSPVVPIDAIDSTLYEVNGTETTTTSSQTEESSTESTGSTPSLENLVLNKTTSGETDTSVTTASVTTTVSMTTGEDEAMTPLEAFTGPTPVTEKETTEESSDQDTASTKQDSTSVLMALTTESIDSEGRDQKDGDDKETTSPAPLSQMAHNGTGKVSSVTDLAILANYEPDFDEKACEANVCRNGGTCLATLTGPKCHCPLQFSGRQCEEEVQVEMPGFVGHSLLVHQLNNQTKGFDLMLSFRTSTQNGLLFYTGAKDEFMVAAYIQGGVLKFKVNCGTQVILFTDPRNRVDSGYQQSIRVNLNLDDPTKCSTVIQLNETHTMKGEQEISVMPNQPDLIYFGLMPHKRDPEVEIINNGFQGCMKHLQLNNIEVHLYKDALSGRDIVECQTAVCAIKPCRNGAVCTQHEESGSWFCNCPPGFTGSLCERPVCNTNPCRYGGTCLGSNAGPGFLCLCPVGRGGALCQDELKITQPSFTSSVGGYSSYLAYPVVPSEVSADLEAQFHFSSLTTDQVALLFFLGQEGFHEYGSDYVAISYVKGHVLFTWDLGAGPRRIFTTRPVDERYLVHSVQFGRRGRLGWLQVDHFSNITGRAPGLRENLNVSSNYLYVGGHENHNFTLLPHDLPVHRGFQGCIFDIAVRSPLGQLIPLALPSASGSTAKGRNVHQCYTDVCSSNPCSNGGTCIPYGASFICECPDGRFGVTCSEESSACTTGRHMCAEGSKCSVVKDGAYECLCPLGKSGEHCNEDISISDPLFSGEHAYMSLTLDSAVRFNTELSLEIRPDSVDGLVVHFGQSRDARHRDFFSVMLRNATLVFSFSLGGPRGGQANSLSLSLCCLTEGHWHKIEAGRSGREGYLKLDSQVTKGTAPPGLTTLDVDHTIYLGGTGPEDAYYQDPEITDPHFSGCMRNLHLNGLFYPLSASRGWIGWAIEDCDGTACGGEVCQNDGVCTLEPSRTGGYSCTCSKEFRGKNCELNSLCEDAGGCQNGATCHVVKDEVTCDCDVGFVGDRCENQADLDVPMFNGESYLSIPIPDTKTLRHVTTFELELKTTSIDGMLIWIGEDLSSDDYLGVGLRSGMVHLVWNLGWFSRTELTIPSPEIKVNDGAWHSIKVNRVRQNLDIEVDGEIYNSRVTGSYYELNTANNVLLGGTNGHGNILDVTRGHFKSSFVGCVRKIVIQNLEVEVSQTGIHGKNVKACTMP